MKWKNLFLFFFVSLCAGPAQALTLSELLTQTRLYLKDTSVTSPSFSDAQLTTFLNNAQADVNSRVWAVIKSSAITIISTQVRYSLPTDCQLIIRVVVDSVPVVERTVSFLDDSQVGWVSSTGTVQSYFVESSTRIGFYPAGSGTATVEYLSKTSDLSGSDVPFLGRSQFYPYHYVLAFYAAYMGYLTEGILDYAVYFKMEYEAGVQLMDKMTQTRQQYNPNFRSGSIQQSLPSSGK